MNKGYVVINAGSSSIKFSVFVAEGNGHLDKVTSGEIEKLGISPHFFAQSPDGAVLAERHWDANASYEVLLSHLITWIEAHLAPIPLAAAGHRVVHGGHFYVAPILATPEVIRNLKTLIPLAPLHQPHNLLPIEALAERHPDLPQVACFDTAFHSTNSRISRLYALPRTLTDEGIQRYGFHGLSYEYIAAELPAHEPRAATGRSVVAHLGNGASMCALIAGRSIASTMGFSTLDGLPMGTRSGTLDPGVLLYLLQQKHMSVAAIDKMLYERAGLLGVSNTSSDMRELLRSKNPHAKEAIDLFIYRIGRELGSLVAAAGGLDTLVFTGGIGQHAPAIRARICADAAWLGIRLDATANLAAANPAGATCISSPDSPISVWVLPTDEEWMIAKHIRTLLDSGRQS